MATPRTTTKTTNRKAAADGEYLFLGAPTTKALVWNIHDDITGFTEPQMLPALPEASGVRSTMPAAEPKRNLRDAKVLNEDELDEDFIDTEAEELEDELGVEDELDEDFDLAEIVVSGARATTRFPDLVVFTDELAEVLQNARRSTIEPDMPPPALVVEVVSPGKTNEDRDYRYKRSEYAARAIAEYWIVDPDKAQVMVLQLVDGLYEEALFTGAEKIQSQVFPALEITTQQVLKAGQ